MMTPMGKGEDLKFNKIDEVPNKHEQEEQKSIRSDLAHVEG